MMPMGGPEMDVVGACTYVEWDTLGLVSFFFFFFLN